MFALGLYSLPSSTPDKTRISHPLITEASHPDILTSTKSTPPFRTSPPSSSQNLCKSWKFLLPSSKIQVFRLSLSLDLSPMDDVKDKMKGLMKNPFSSSSAKFKGQGRVLGSATPPPSSSTTPHRPPTRLIPAPNRPTPPPPNPAAGFDPYDPLLTTSRRSANGCSLAVFQCPVCARAFPSEPDVAAHLDDCLAHGPKVAGCVAAFVSAGPKEGAVDVVTRLLRNVAGQPGNEKFRRIRMGNPKIKEAVGDAEGGVELLECVGFRLGEEGGEVWATMDAPEEDQVSVIKEAVLLLESWSPVVSKKEGATVVAENSPVVPKEIDRQVRVFFSVPENVAAKIDMPASFYELSSQEVKREADARKKKLAESQLLIPKSFREKQAMAARTKYKRTVIRIQFPDGVVLQGVFLPWEPTIMLYQFVKSAIKEASLEFELLRPAVPKPRVITCAVKEGDRIPTLEEEDLVPSALVKFKPIETDSIVFTGLSNELLEASEPLITPAT